MAAHELASNILRYRGGLNKNNLLEIFKNIENYEEMLSCCSQSPYIDINNVCQYFESHKDDFTVLDFNIQSLNAKFDMFVSFLDELSSSGFYFSAICLQETWIKSNTFDTNIFKIPNYNMYHVPARLSSHSGVALYIHESYNAKLLQHDALNSCEGIYAEISGPGLTKNLVLGNIYRPPRDTNEQIKYFINDLIKIINSINNNKNDIIICGDFNIDLLKVESRSLYSEYLEIIFSMSLIPSINLPTRLSRRNATLIDNIFSKLSPNIIQNSCIIVNDISDHFMPVLCLQNKIPRKIKPKHITVQTSDPNAINNFVSSVSNINFSSIIDTEIAADPNNNYEIFKNTIDEALQKHLPSKTVKFHKHKHKINPWITKGCIRSIRTRDIMYRQLKQMHPGSNKYDKLKEKLDSYKTTLRKSLRQAKFSYYTSLFEKYKNDSKKSWKLINSLIGNSVNKNNITKLFIINGTAVKNEAQIADNFNDFFTNIGHLQASKIPPTNPDKFTEYLINPATTCFKFSMINENDIQ